MENNTQSQNVQIEDGTQPTIPNDNETQTNDNGPQINVQDEQNRLQNEKNRLKHKTNFEKWLNGEIENSDQNQAENEQEDGQQQEQQDEEQQDEDEDREQEPGGERVLEKKANGQTSKIMDNKRAQMIIEILKRRLPYPSSNFKYYIKKTSLMFKC